MPEWYEDTNIPALRVLAESIVARDEYELIGVSFGKFPVLGLQYALRLVIIKEDESGLHSQSLDELANLLISSTTTNVGTVILATLTEVNTGTDTTKIVTVYNLHEKTMQIIEYSGTGRLINNTDKHDLIKCTNGSAVTMTLPLDSTENLDTGFVTHVAQYGAGQIQVVGQSGVSVNFALSAYTKNQYSMLSIIKTGANEFYLQGGQAG